MPLLSLELWKVMISLPTLPKLCDLHASSFQRSLIFILYLNLGASYTPSTLGCACNTTRNFISYILTLPQVDTTFIVIRISTYWRSERTFTGSSDLFSHSHPIQFFPTPDLSDTYLTAKALSFTFSISRRDFRTVSFSRLYRASHLYLLHEINACRRLGESFQGVTPSFQFSK